MTRRNGQRITGLYFPDAVVVDRSAVEAMPSADSSLFLDAGPSYSRRRPVALPGLTIRPRRGPGPVPGDMPFMDSLHLSGPGRKFLENVRPSRAREGEVSRTLSRSELEDELRRLAAAQRGAGFDPRRLNLFEALQARILQTQLPERPEQTDSLPALSFIEAYFSSC